MSYSNIHDDDERLNTFLADALKGYEKDLELRNNEDYLVNLPQVSKFKEAYEFFSEICRDSEDGKIEVKDIQPKERHGGITATLPLFYLDGEKLKQFTKIAENFGALSIDSFRDGRICISFTVPDVFIEKPKGTETITTRTEDF